MEPLQDRFEEVLVRDSFDDLGRHFLIIIYSHLRENQLRRKLDYLGCSARSFLWNRLDNIGTLQPLRA